MIKTAKSSDGWLEILRQEDGRLGLRVYKNDGSGIASSTSWNGVKNCDPQYFFDMFTFLYPEIVGGEYMPADFEERLRAAIKNLAEDDDDIIERIKNYTDGETS
jgi:hypothetical protein